MRNTKSTGKLTVAILGDAASNAVALKAFKAFQGQTGITTTPLFINVPTWVDFFEQIETRLIGGVQIDTMNLATEGFRLFASKGVLAPLDSYIAQDKAAINAFYADVNPRTLSEFRQHAQIGGHTYYIPWGYNTMGIWYNRATFKAGNVAEPAPDWTWDDFLAAATALTKPPQNWGMNLTIDVFQGIEPWVFTNGGTVLNNSWTSCVINNPAAVEACTFAAKPGGKEARSFAWGHLQPVQRPRPGTSRHDGGGHLALELLRRERRGKRARYSPLAEESSAGFPGRPGRFSGPRRLEQQGRSVGVRQVLDFGGLPSQRGRPDRGRDANAYVDCQQPVVPEDPASGGRVLYCRAQLRHSGRRCHECLGRRGRHRLYVAANPVGGNIAFGWVGATGEQSERRAERQLNAPR